MDPCDGCGEELGDTFNAVGALEVVIFVCDTCRGILHRIDLAIDTGVVTETEAAREFARLRWGGRNARGPRRGDGDRELPMLSTPRLLSPATPAPAGIEL